MPGTDLGVGSPVRIGIRCQFGVVVSTFRGTREIVGTWWVCPKLVPPLVLGMVNVVSCGTLYRLYFIHISRVQVVGPTGRWSDGSLVRRVVGPTGRWSDGSLVRRVVGPTGRWSDGSLVRRVVGPTGRWSDGSLVRRVQFQHFYM